MNKHNEVWLKMAKRVWKAWQIADRGEELWRQYQKEGEKRVLNAKRLVEKLAAFEAFVDKTFVEVEDK